MLYKKNRRISSTLYHIFIPHTVRFLCTVSIWTFGINYKKKKKLNDILKKIIIMRTIALVSRFSLTDRHSRTNDDVHRVVTNYRTVHMLY